MHTHVVYFDILDKGKKFVDGTLHGIIQQVDTHSMQLYDQSNHMLMRIDNPQCYINRALPTVEKMGSGYDDVYGIEPASMMDRRVQNILDMWLHSQH